MIPLLALGLLIAGVFAVAVAFSLAALELHTRNTRKSVRRKALEARWEPLVLRALDTGDPAPLVASVASSERLFFIDFIFRYATRLRGRDRATLIRAAAPFLPDLRSKLRPGAEVEQRARAVRTVGLLGGDDFMAEIVSAIESRSPLVAMSGARALALRGDPRVVDLFLGHAERFGDWSPRFFASMLASTGPAVCPALREIALDGQRGGWTRRVAIDALTELNDLAAGGVAALVLEGSDDRDLQCACLRLLERLGTPADAAAPRVLIGSRDPMVRLCAISTVGALGSRSDIQALRVILDAKDMWLVLNAARALHKLGDDVFLAALARTNEARARLAAQVLREAAP